MTPAASEFDDSAARPDPGPRPPSRALAVTPGGLIGTLLLLLVVAGCVRLGFWQLSRHEQRQQRNAQVAARLDMSPLPVAALMGDTTGTFYRTVTVSGTFDADRAIVLPGRSHRGVPGVYLLTPLRLDDAGGRALMVNRGWVPSPDAATVDVAQLAEHEPVTLTGLVLPFPGADQSLAQRPGGGAGGEGFRRVWYAIDEQALRTQFPYAMLPVMVQALPEPGAPAAVRGSYPVRLEPPPLDDGPHFGYAVQWFAFALIGVIGWVALVLRGRAPARTPAPPLPPARAGLLLVPLAGLLAGPCLAGGSAAAQLRPLDPAEWRVFDDSVWLVVSGGIGFLQDHRASLAGTTGSLLEAGNYAVTFRAARIAVSLSGTAVLRLTNEEVFAEPIGAAHAPNGGARHSAGRAIAATLFRVSPADWPVDLLVRFGAVLPTTSHRSGLDRDRTDFFAFAGARYRRGPLTLTTEHGVGINGTVLSDYPQSDVWAYSAAASVDLSSLAHDVPVAAVVELVGHHDGLDWLIRGNEDLEELRAGIELGRTWKVAVHHIRGRSQWSPSSGWRMSGGFVLDRRH